MKVFTVLQLEPLSPLVLSSSLVPEFQRSSSTSSNCTILPLREVDILADGALDYPDDLLCELDYTVCSVHSRFALGKAQQTERILRAMDNRYFHILGHATGRLLLKRPGYEIDIERIILHAKHNRCSSYPWPSHASSRLEGHSHLWLARYGST
jgi:DNA polymerase (family 10)